MCDGIRFRSLFFYKKLSYIQSRLYILIYYASLRKAQKVFETRILLTSPQFFRLRLFQDQGAFHELRTGFNRIYTAVYLWKLNLFLVTLISMDFALDCSNVWIKSMSSTGLPSEADSLWRILSSISFNSCLIFALLTINWFFASSRSGLSSATTKASSWSSRPLKNEKKPDFKYHELYQEGEDPLESMKRSKKVEWNSVPTFRLFWTDN